MKFGITPTFPCSYLDQQEEQLLVFVEECQSASKEDKNLAGNHYAKLIQAGFRRSGEQIYRPHCPNCQACQSLRIPVNQFVPSRSQKRILNKNQHFETRLSRSIQDSYYTLYERYIEARHRDGSMYPPDKEQFVSFVECDWKKPLYIEGYNNGQLIGVAVTDEIDTHTPHPHGALSALYTFFDVEYTDHSIGTWMILEQIAWAKKLQKAYLYLGYQIDESQKMNYKGNFYPHERFIDNIWQGFSKK